MTKNSERVVPQPVSADDDGWDLQQRNVEQQIENAIFRPTLGDGDLYVERFFHDADIQDHMLPASHGKYGLDTHTYRFSVEAQRQFWQWHFRNEERIRLERLAEHERKTAEFNRKINERRQKIEDAKPAIEAISAPKMRRDDFGVKVRATVGSGPGPLRYYYFAFRPTDMRGQPDHTWTKWGKDFRGHNMPKEELIYTLDPNRSYDIAVYGGSRHGGVYSDPVTVAFVGGEVEDTPPAPGREPGETLPDAGGATQETAPPASGEPEPATGGRQHRFRGTWGYAWNQFPGIAPGRNYGEIENPAFTRPDGGMSLVTAVFCMTPGILRLTLQKDTDADQFPDHVKAGDTVFARPGKRQLFGLGHARDYTRVSGDSSDVRVGKKCEFVLEFSE